MSISVDVSQFLKLRDIASECGLEINLAATDYLTILASGVCLQTYSNIDSAYNFVLGYKSWYDKYNEVKDVN